MPGLLFSRVFGHNRCGWNIFWREPSNTEWEIDHLLRLGQPTHIVTSSDIAQKALNSAVRHKIARNCVWILDLETFAHPDQRPYLAPIESPSASKIGRVNSNGCRGFIELTQHGESDWIQICDEQTAEASRAAMFCTSGTSGPTESCSLESLCARSSLSKRGGESAIRCAKTAFPAVLPRLGCNLCPCIPDSLGPAAVYHAAVRPAEVCSGR